MLAIQRPNNTHIEIGIKKKKEQREELIPYNPTCKVALHVLPCHLEPVESMA